MSILRGRSAWQWLLLALAVGLLLLTLRNIPLTDVWMQLRALQPDQILLLVLANVLVLATFSARWWILLFAQGYALPYHKLMAYRLATFAVSYFTPGPHFGGEPLQVYVVSRRHAVPGAVSLAAVVLDKLIEMIFNFTFVVVGALFVLQTQTGILGQMQTGAALGVGALFLLPVLILAALAAGRHPLSWPLTQVLHNRFLRKRISAHSKAGHFVITLRESEDLGSRLFRQRPWLLLGAVLVTVVSWVAIVAEFWLMTYVLGMGLSVPQALVALLAARAAILLPLPAAVGALEASQALAMVSLGLPASYGISLSLLIRGRDVLLGLVGLGLAAGYLQGGGEGERVRG
jgi:uncharacterized protein (TIRG00374 family)